MRYGALRRYRWVVLAVFVFFAVTHNTDKLMIGFLTDLVMDEFGITYSQMGLVFTSALIVALVLNPTWGYLYDRFVRKNLISLASAIWGLTTWLSALSANYSQFLVARASTGIDDSCYSGIYSTLADYFRPEERGLAISLISSSQVIGAILGGTLAVSIGYAMGWRYAYYLTGSIGIILAFLIYFLVKEPPRGVSEPELAGLPEVSTYRISREKVAAIFRRRTFIFLSLQGFFGVFPWQVITFWMFKYLLDERMYPEDEATFTMILWMVVMFFGFVAGGRIGDFLFRRSRRGRVLLSAAAVFLGAVLIYITLTSTDDLLFKLLGAVTAFVLPMPDANINATIHDVIEPESRSTALSFLGIVGSVGSAFAPLLAGVIADIYGLGTAIIVISVAAWLLCTLFLSIAVIFVEEDMERLRRLMAERAEAEMKRLT